MKKYILLLISTLLCVITFAQSPRTNLGKTISEVRNTYPSMNYKGNRLGWEEYESGNVTLSFKRDVLVCETTMIQRGLQTGADIFDKYVRNLLKTDFERHTKLEHDSLGYNITFYYKDFSIYVSYDTMDGMVLIVEQSFDYFK